MNNPLIFIKSMGAAALVVTMAGCGGATTPVATTTTIDAHTLEVSQRAAKLFTMVRSCSPGAAIKSGDMSYAVTFSDSDGVEQREATC